MKHIHYVIIALLLLASCDSTKKATESEETAVAVAQPAPKAKTMLLGKEKRASLEAAPFGTWFNTNYANYKVKEDQIPVITEGLEGVTITTFMGTWCGDSKRETPRMYKILDETKFKETDLELITVDRSKQKPEELTAGNNIVRVPTFIFKKDGKEIGRIVEHPVESLEEDMVKILNGDPYKHAYAN